MARLATACLTLCAHTRTAFRRLPTPRRTQHHCDGAGGQGPHFLPGQVRSFLFVKERLGFVYRVVVFAMICVGTSCARSSLRPSEHLSKIVLQTCHVCSGLLTIGPRFGGAIDDAARYFKQACDQVCCRGSTVGNPMVIDRLVCSDKGWHFSVGIHWSSCTLGWTLGWTLRPNRGARSCEYWPSPHADIFLVQNQDPDEFVEMMKRRGIR